jgi:hypothetical protein
MKVPSYVTMYHNGKRIKIGAECPKELEETLKKAIAATKKRAKALGERFAPYDGEEKVIAGCSQYPEFTAEVARVYHETRKAKADKEKDKK